MSDTTTKHIGNLLFKSSEKELSEILNQCMSKMNLSKEGLLDYFSRIIHNNNFDYYGNMIEEESFENSNCLIKGDSRFIVKTHESNFGYEADHEYIFESEEEVYKFLGFKDNYETNEYQEGTDIQGNKVKIQDHEFATEIYEKTEYPIKYSSDKN